MSDDMTRRTVTVTAPDAWADDLDIIEVLAQSILDQVADIRAAREGVNYDLQTRPPSPMG